MIQKKSEDAVSPVIGVMLLLVVTIVIAAVVAVFASGVGADAEPAPTTVLDVVDICDEGYSTVSSLEGTEPVTVWNFYWDDVITDKRNEIYYADGEAAALGFYDRVMANTGEVFEYLGAQMYYKDGVFNINNKPMAGQERIVYANAVNTPEFELVSEYCVVNQVIDGGTFEPVIVTIDCLAGDILNKEKLSIKVYDSNGVLAAVKNQNSLSGTLNPGDTLAIQVDELLTNPDDPNDFNAVVEGDKVEVFVLYGEHVIVSKELKVSGT